MEERLSETQETPIGLKIANVKINRAMAAYDSGYRLRLHMVSTHNNPDLIDQLYEYERTHRTYRQYVLNHCYPILNNIECIALSLLVSTLTITGAATCLYLIKMQNVEEL